VLGDDLARIDNLVVDPVPEGICQGIHDDLECPPLVVAFQILDVLQHECSRTMKLKDVGYLEKEIPLLFVFKTVLSSEADLLRDPGDAERLAWETAAKNIKRGNVSHGYLVDISMGLLTMVGLICNPAVLVPIAREDALGSNTFETKSKSADAAK
jgi:hypothetical protein